MEANFYKPFFVLLRAYLSINWHLSTLIITSRGVLKYSVILTPNSLHFVNNEKLIFLIGPIQYWSQICKLYQKSFVIYFKYGIVKAWNTYFKKLKHLFQMKRWKNLKHLSLWGIVKTWNTYCKNLKQLCKNLKNLFQMRRFKNLKHLFLWGIVKTWNTYCKNLKHLFQMRHCKNLKHWKNLKHLS